MNHTEQKLVDRNNNSANYMGQVFTVMLLQILREYNGIQNYRDLTKTEIKFFYDGMRAELMKKVKDG